MQLLKLTFILFFLYSYAPSNAQSIDLESTDNDNRVMLQLRFPLNTTQSSNQLKLSSGTNTNESTAEVASWAGSYTATPGYAGYGGFTNRKSGLILRATDPSGEVRFLVGGGTPATHTRMTINAVGNVGIGTDAPASRLQLQNGDIFLNEIGKGVIMKSANGGCWRLAVSNTGTPSFSSVACPL